MAEEDRLTGQEGCACIKLKLKPAYYLSPIGVIDCYLQVP